MATKIKSTRRFVPKGHSQRKPQDPAHVNSERGLSRVVGKWVCVLKQPDAFYEGIISESHIFVQYSRSFVPGANPSVLRNQIHVTAIPVGKVLFEKGAIKFLSNADARHTGTRTEVYVEKGPNPIQDDKKHDQGKRKGPIPNQTRPHFSYTASGKGRNRAPNDPALLRRPDRTQSPPPDIGRQHCDF